jgi:hypothetical protein
VIYVKGSCNRLNRVRIAARAQAAGGECGDLNIAVNPWVGYEAANA